ncbi:penicillin-binding protein 1C [Aquabacterium soli]
MTRRPAAILWAAMALGFATTVVHALPSYQQVRQAYTPSDLSLLDRHGQPLQTVRVDNRARRLSWVGLQEVSPALRMAIVLSEDQRFWAHGGVDWRAVAASTWANAWNQRTRGASTVTMQLAGLLDKAQARPADGRSITGKLRQTMGAATLERQWRKSDILEAYLNLVPFRGELVGLHALSLTLFGKHPSGLDAQEAAIAAALVRGPNAAPAVVSQRACQVLRQMQPGQGCAGLALFTQAALQRKGGMPLGEQAAPHAARQVLQAAREAGQGKGAAAPWPSALRTTLDATTQRLATQLLKQQLAELGRRDVEDGAVIVLDNATGDVLAWVGSAGSLASAREVDGVIARRQPGSTLKPFIYELAFERRLLTPASLLDDSPVQMPTTNGLYTPQNYDRQFKGWVSTRHALGSSLNIPAVRAGAMLGEQAVAQRFNALGLALREPGGFYGPGLALGSAEVTLRDLANAYRALAQGGVWSPVRWLPIDTKARPSAAQPPRRVMQPQAVYLVTHILADNSARAATFGLDSQLATRGFAAVKTGTSKDMRDNWCLGYSDRYTVGVWIGNASGAPMQAVSGTTGAAPVWSRLMAELHRGTPSRPPTPPAGVIEQPVRFAGWAQAEPARDEWFIAGTQQAVWQVQPPPVLRVIRNPQDSAIYALDPDIPPNVQRLSFETGTVLGRRHSWWLDGKRLRTTSAGSPQPWLPWPGRHTLELREGNTVIDRVRFEVRGAAPRRQAAS